MELAFSSLAYVKNKKGSACQWTEWSMIYELHYPRSTPVNQEAGTCIPLTCPRHSSMHRYFSFIFFKL